MSQPTDQRPPQVTLASGIIIFSSVIVMLSAWERVSTLGSLETQQSIQQFLAEAPFSSLGLDAAGASELLRIACLVAAAAACATAVLGWYVRKPDRSARLGLSIFAAPVFVAGLAAGGLAASFVAAGAAMLWVMPAREWFATGRWTPPAPPPQADARPRRTPFGRRGEQSGQSGQSDRSGQSVRSGQRGQVGQPGEADPTAPTVASGSSPMAPPPATRPFGEHRSESLRDLPHRHEHPQERGHDQLLHARPGAMVAAFVITVVTAGGLLTLSLLWLAVAGLSPELLRSALEQQQPDLFDDGLTFGQLRSTLLAYSVCFVVWCVVALTLAGYAMARRDWARRGLMFVAAFSAGGCLVFVTSTSLVVIPAAAAVATVLCLRRIEVRQWFSAASH